jgi:single-strand DNA-binding protein
MSLNKVMLIGNLGSDPDLRYTQGGSAVANFNLATNEKWTDKSGQLQEKTEWHRIVVWGKQAENCGKYLKKGRQIFVEGRLQTRDWEDKDGKKRYTTEIKADNVQFLSGGGDSPSGRDYGGPSGGSSGGDGGNNDSGPEASFDQSFNDDDIPF